MAQRDVELRVRAKAQTDKSLERLSGILREIEKDGADSVKGLNKSSEAVRAVGTEINRLQTEIGKLKAFDKLVAEVQKSNEALATSKKQLKDNAAEFAALARQQDAAGQAAVRYRAQMDAEKANLKQLSDARKADADALKKVERDLDRAGKALDVYNEKLRKTGKDPATDSGSIARGAALSTLGSARDELKGSVASFDTQIAQATAQLADYTAKTKAADDANKELKKQVNATETAISAQRIQVEANELALAGAKTKADQASAALRGVAADQAAIAAATDRATSELNQQKAALERITNAERELAERRRQSNFEGRDALTITQRIKAEVLALITAYIGLNGAIQSISNAINATRDLEAATNRLGTVFDQDMGRVGEEMDFVRGTADRLGIAMTDLGLAYSKFAVAADGSKFSAEATRKVFVGVAEAGRVNKLSLDQLNGVFLALEQMISKGKIQAEELRGQLGERLPGAVSILADALGVTTAELDKLMEQGQVFATEETMLKFVDELGNRFSAQLPASLQSLSAEMGRFENDLDKVALAFAEGVIPGVREALNAFNAFVNSTAGQEFFVNLGTAVGQAVQAIGWLIENFETVKLVIMGFLSLAVGTKVAGWAVAIGTFAQSVLKAKGAMNLFEYAAYKLGVAVRLAGGPWTVFIGLAVAAASAVAAFWGMSSVGAGDATLAMSEHQRQMNAVNEAYQTATDKTAAWAENIRNVKLPEAAATLTDLEDAYAGALEPVIDVAVDLQDELDNIILRAETAERQFKLFGDEADSAIAKSLRSQAESKKTFVNLIAELNSGSITLEQFRATLDQIYRTTDNPAIKDMAQDLSVAVSVAEEGSQSIAELYGNLEMQRAIVKGLSGDWSDYYEILDRGKKSTDGAADGMKSNADSAQLFSDALNELKSKIPSLSEEMERLKKINALRDAWEDASKLATSMDDAVRALRAYQMGLDELNRTETNWEAVYTAGRGAPQGAQMEELVRATTALAEQMGLSAKDLLTVMSYETGGKFDPSLMGGAGGNHLGLIQFSPDNQARYGVSQSSTITEQVVAAGQYLQDAGVKAGDGLLQIYAAINAGSPTNIHASDEANGGMPGTVLDKVNEQMDGHKARAEGLLAAYAGVSEEAAKIAIEEARVAETTKNRIADLQFEVDQQALLAAGEEKRVAINEALRAAKADGITDPTALADIEALTAKNWELANAKSAITLEEEKVNNLMAMRSELEAQLEMAKEAGDTTLAATLGQDLTNINAEITAAIDNLIRMWEAAGGPEADLAIAKLRTYQLETSKVKHETGALGLSFDTWKNIANTAINGVVNAFDAMAQAIANGENAAKAFGTAMLQMFAQLLRDIALAIIKQMILNALLGFTGGKGTFFGDILIGLGAKGHTGGLVGGSAIGAGNSLSSGMSAWRSGLSYHTGGIAGLKPDEVSATLRVNEEILTEDDPRHRFNLGGESAPAQSGLRQVLAIGDDEIANAMSGRAGEKTVMTILRRNVPTLRQYLK